MPGGRTTSGAEGAQRLRLLVSTGMAAATLLLGIPLLIAHGAFSGDLLVALIVLAACWWRRCWC